MLELKYETSPTDEARHVLLRMERVLAVRRKISLDAAYDEDLYHKSLAPSHGDG